MSLGPAATWLVALLLCTAACCTTGATLNARGLLRSTTSDKDPDCDASKLPEAEAVMNESSCKSHLRVFYGETTQEAFARKNGAERAAVLDALCTLPCGDVYTTFLYASRTMDHQCQRNIFMPKGGDYDTSIKYDPMLDKMVSKGHYKPNHDYPGLLLGCKKSEEGGQYCALLKGDVNDGTCDFYRSCCYGDFLALNEDRSIIDRIETMCPGSREYSTKRC